MKKVFGFLFLLGTANVYAQSYRTVHNPFTGTQDYVVNVASTSVGALVDVSTIGATSGQCLQWNGTKFVPASCGGMTPGSTFYIQNQNSLQSGATFYVSSGTVNGEFHAGNWFGSGVSIIQEPFSNLAQFKINGSAGAFSSEAPLTVQGAFSGGGTNGVGALIQDTHSPGYGVSQLNFKYNNSISITTTGTSYIKGYGDSGGQHLLMLEGLGVDNSSLSLDPSAATFSKGIVVPGFKLSASPSNGYVLTSDGSGNGTWQVSAGGSGASSLAVGTGTASNFTTQVSSPTSSLSFLGTQFRSVASGTTNFISIDPSILGGMTSGSTNYIQNSNTLQSGSTFYVSSGTLAGQLSVNSIKFADGTIQVSSPTAGGGGSPGGSTTQVQYNDGGSFAGDSTFTWDKTNKQLSLYGSTYGTKYDHIKMYSQFSDEMLFTTEGDKAYMEWADNSGGNPIYLLGLPAFRTVRYSLDPNPVAYVGMTIADATHLNTDFVVNNAGGYSTFTANYLGWDFIASSGFNEILFHKSAGNLVAKWDTNDTFNLYQNNAAQKVLVVRGAASQSVNLQEWQDSSASTLSHVDKNGAFFTYSRTKAQLSTEVPTAAGGMYYCSDCTTDAIVVSTGTAAGSFARISARTTPIN